jgi:K+-transporting ATPase A subunit
MRILTLLLLLPAMALAQSSQADPAAPAKTENKNQLVLPSGSKIPVALQIAISTKSAKGGDPVYAETTFPFLLNDKIVVPAGTYVQGRIARVQRAGHLKGRAEMLMYFTTLIYPDGYTVLLPGALDSVPGTEDTKMKDQEGTVQKESQKGKDAEKIVTAGTTGAGAGALVGALASRSSGGTLAGAGAGAALGVGLALFSRGPDVRLEKGTTIEMIIQRDVSLDPVRVEASVKQAQARLAR